MYNVWLQTFELRTSNFSVEFVFDQLVIKVNVKQLELKGKVTCAMSLLHISGISLAKHCQTLNIRAIITQ